MKNVSERLPIQERISVLDGFCQKLANSGYSRTQARRIIISGLKGYEGIRLKAEKAGKNIYRSAKEGQSGRNLK